MAENNDKIEQLLIGITNKLNGSKVLNGGFDKMSEELSELKQAQVKICIELENLKKSNEAKEEVLSEIRDALYEPDHGLYKRVNTVVDDTEILYKEVEKINKKSDSFERRLKPVETTHQSLEDIAGSKLEHLKTNIETNKANIEIRKNKNKLWWTMAAAVLAGFVKTCWEIISHFI